MLSFALTKGRRDLDQSVSRNLNIFRCKFCAAGENDSKQAVVILNPYLPIISSVICRICAFKVERHPCPPV